MNSLKRKFIKEFHLTIAPKRLRYLGINSIKEVQDLYTPNHKMFLGKKKTNLNKQKNRLCAKDWEPHSCLDGNISQSVLRINAIPITLPNFKMHYKAVVIKAGRYCREGKGTQLSVQTLATQSVSPTCQHDSVGGGKRSFNKWCWEI